MAPSSELFSNEDQSDNFAAKSTKKKSLLVPAGVSVDGHAGSGQNSNKAVAGAASKTFARWLHYRYVPTKLPLVASYRFVAR